MQTDSTPDISLLMEVTSKMNKAISAADSSFEELFALNAQVRIHKNLFTIFFYLFILFNLVYIKASSSVLRSTAPTPRAIAR